MIEYKNSQVIDYVFGITKNIFEDIIMLEALYYTVIILKVYINKI